MIYQISSSNFMATNNLLGQETIFHTNAIIVQENNQTCQMSDYDE